MGEGGKGWYLNSLIAMLDPFFGIFEIALQSLLLLRQEFHLIVTLESRGYQNKQSLARRKEGGEKKVNMK